MYSFARLDLMRCRLKWAYERPLVDSQGTSPYIASPIAAWLVRKGTITVHFRDGSREVCGPGEWIFPKEAEGVQTHEGLVILSIRFQAVWNHGDWLFPRQRTERIPAADVPTLTQAAEGLVASVNQHAAQEPGWVMKGELPGYWEVQRSFLHWLAVWYEAMTRHGVSLNLPDALDPKVRRALEILATRPLHLSLQEKELAREVGLSVSQLNKLFSAQTNATPAAHWQRRKMETAQTMIIGGGESIKAIAYQLGFSTPEYFTTWFRKHHGITPTRLRQRYQTTRAGDQWV